MALTELADAPRGFGAYRLTVSDTGCGMTPEFLERIFLPFERDGLGYANKTEGTGLGMTITKSLVDLMGGEIAVESVVGRGSTFAITLPLRAADADELAEAREKAVAAERCQRDFTGCKVLVVDDDDLSREILVEILKDYGFKPEEARDGDAAVRKVASVEPFYYDAVLMDMRMPRHAAHHRRDGRRLRGGPAPRPRRRHDGADYQAAEHPRAGSASGRVHSREIETRGPRAARAFLHRRFEEVRS